MDFKTTSSYEITGGEQAYLSLADLSWVNPLGSSQSCKQEVGLGREAVPFLLDFQSVVFKWTVSFYFSPLNLVPSTERNTFPLSVHVT